MRTAGLESSPVAAALAGLRANEARYFTNKYDHVFAVDAAAAPETVDWVHGVLKDERDIVIAARPLEATSFEVDGTRMAYVFYESGLSVNVMYGLEAGRSGPSASSSPRAWRSPRSSRRASGSPPRSPSWRARSGGPTS